MKTTNDFLTSLTKIIGNNLAKLREKNKLIETNQKISNPSFLDILEDLLEDDPVLAIGLINWYINKYGEKDVSTNIDINKFIKSLSNDVLKNKHKNDDYYGGSCGYSVSCGRKTCSCGSNSYSSC